MDYLSKIKEDLQRIMFNIEELERLSRIVEDISSLKKNALKSKSRKEELQYNRVLFTIIAFKTLDIKRTELMKYLNRDRALSYHYEKNHEVDYSFVKFYRDNYDLAYQRFTGDKKFVFITKDHLDRVLKRENIPNTMGNRFKITLKIGKKMRNFKRSCPDKLINKLGKIFENYESEFRIKEIS